MRIDVYLQPGNAPRVTTAGNAQVSDAQMKPAKHQKLRGRFRFRARAVVRQVK